LPDQSKHVELLHDTELKKFWILRQLKCRTDVIIILAVPRILRD